MVALSFATLFKSRGVLALSLVRAVGSEGETREGRRKCTSKSDQPFGWIQTNVHNFELFRADGRV